jgi:nitroreductase
MRNRRLLPMWKLLEAILAIGFFFLAVNTTVYGPVWVSFWMAARPLSRRGDQLFDVCGAGTNLCDHVSQV